MQYRVEISDAHIYVVEASTMQSAVKAAMVAHSDGYADGVSGPQFGPVTYTVEPLAE